MPLTPLAVSRYDEPMNPHGLGPLTLDVGPSGSGKTTAALAEYAALLRRRGGTGAPAPAWGRRRAVWIAPTRATAQDVRDALATQAGAVLDPGVTTFSGIAAEVLRDAGVLVIPITSLQRRRLLGRLIAEAAEAGELQFYGPVAGSPGLISIVDEQLADLQARALSPAKVRQQAERQDDPRARDVALLFSAYHERLNAANAAGATVVDAETLLSTAAAALGESPELAAGLELAVVDGFSDFTTVEQQLVIQLARRTQRLIVTLPGDAADASASRTDLFAQPLQAAESLKHAPRVKLGGSPVRRPPPAPDAWPALAHLERNLFRTYRELEPPSPAVVGSLDRLHIVAASGVQAEMVEIARRVKGLLASGVAPGDVVVAFRTTRDVADRLRQTFDDYGIPFRLDNERRLAASPLVRSLNGVLRLAADDWPYRRLLQMTGDCSLRVFDVAAETCDAPNARQAIETCVRYAQLPSGRRALFGQLAAWAEDLERTSEPTPADAALARQTLGEVAKLVDVLPKRASIERWVAALGSLAGGVGLLRPATAEAEANWSILARGLRAAERIDALTGNADAELTLPEFLEVFAATAAQVPGSQDNDGVGRVRVLSAEAARFTRPKHLIVGGLSEQSFPIPRRAAAALEMGGDFAANTAASALRSDEMLLFYQLVARPTETLTLTYPALDSRAQTLPASPFLVELERAFGDAKVPRTVQPLNYGQTAQGEFATPLSRSELRRGAVGRALHRERGLLASLTKVDGGAILAGIEAVADRGRRDEFGAFDGVLASDAAAARLRTSFGPEHLWSPSRLERYAACPFLFFGEQLLHLRPTPELALASDVRRRGSVLHETLARLYGALRGQSLDPEQATAVLMENFHSALTAVAESRPGRGVDAAIREIERRQIAAWAKDFARQDSEYRAAWQTLDEPPTPTYFEARFGPGSSRSESPSDAVLSTDEPFSLTTTIDGASERVQFTGQIDRIDVGRVGDRTVFNVIDYKTSAKAAVRDAEIHAGKQIQLPLYAMAVEQLLLAGENAAALSAGYWSVQGKGFAINARSGGPLPIGEIREGVIRPAPSWEGTRDKLIAKIGEIIADIRRGRFPVYNDDANCTDHCDLRTICRIAHVRSLEKVWSPNRMERGNGTRMNAD